MLKMEIHVHVLCRRVFACAFQCRKPPAWPRLTSNGQHSKHTRTSRTISYMYYDTCSRFTRSHSSSRRSLISSSTKNWWKKHKATTTMKRKNVDEAVAVVVYVNCEVKWMCVWTVDILIFVHRIIIIIIFSGSLHAVAHFDCGVCFFFLLFLSLSFRLFHPFRSLSRRRW